MSASAAPPATPSTAPAAPEQPPAPAPLGRPFAAQLTSTGLANLGDGVLATLAPLVALGLTTSPTQIGLLTAATWLPWLLLGIAAGAIIDRVDRRRAQVVALAVRAALLGTAAALVAADALTMPLLVLVVLAYGATEVFADLGATAIVPDLVPTDRLSAANGRIVGVQQVANSFLGAPLAGALIVVGAGLGFGVSAALAALAAVTLAVGLRGSYRRVADEATTRTTTRTTTAIDDAAPTRSAVRTGLTQVRDGLAFLVRHPVLRPLVITSGVLNMASTGYFAVFVLWAVGPTSAAGLTQSQYPLIMVGFAAGAVAGSLLAERVQRRFGEVPTILGTLTANVLLMAVPVLWPNGWVFAGTLAVLGLLNTIGNVVSMSLRQRLVPRHLLGRVGGAGRTLAFGLMPVGAVLGGVVAERWSLPTTFLGAVVVSLAACAYLALTVRPSTVAALLERAEAPAPR
ncbi:MFS transporter [Serinibacter arcticus]|uniref:MFS transporter n=1 Tax=Serinibacter arcticus TaxID=1655435 RepID=A0A2U1ZXJ0_9MICO|nr:MFS transporter [Serinibacter arcticus]PWD51705.1 MFS transporter [Serinibacter arcticus]